MLKQVEGVEKESAGLLSPWFPNECLDRTRWVGGVLAWLKSEMSYLCDLKGGEAQDCRVFVI